MSSGGKGGGGVGREVRSFKSHSCPLHCWQSLSVFESVSVKGLVELVLLSQKGKMMKSSGSNTIVITASTICFKKSTIHLYNI